MFETEFFASPGEERREEPDLRWVSKTKDCGDSWTGLAPVGSELLETVHLAILESSRDEPCALSTAASQYL